MGSCGKLNNVFSSFGRVMFGCGNEWLGVIVIMVGVGKGFFEGWVEWVRDDCFEIVILVELLFINMVEVIIVVVNIEEIVLSIIYFLVSNNFNLVRNFKLVVVLVIYLVILFIEICLG